MIQKADKGNTIVILNRKDYVFKVEAIPNGASKFENVFLEWDKVLNQ